MKVLKILGLVFGILLLLTGAGLLVGSFAANQGDDAIEQSMAQNGLLGPVDGLVTAVDANLVTVDFTDQSGEPQTAQAQAALTRPAQIGDTVAVYYSSDDPSIAIATDLAGGQLSSIASTLRTVGIVCLVVGGLMLIASILALMLGRKAVSPGPPYAVPQAYPPQGQAYPPQGQAYPPQGQGYPPQPGQSYPQQPGQPYPPPPGQPYSPQPGQPYPPHDQPPQNQPPQNQAPQGYSEPPATPYPPAENYDRPSDPGAGVQPQGPPTAR